MAEIAWTSEALRWLEDIFEYIAADNPDAAAETVDDIYQRAQVLAQYPEMGHRFLHSERNVRILLHGNYRIAYLIKRDGNVDILGVFHSALDIKKYQRVRAAALTVAAPSSQSIACSAARNGCGAAPLNWVVRRRLAASQT